MAVKAARVLAALAAHNRFRRIDDLLGDIFPEIPKGSKEWNAALWDLRDDIIALSGYYEAQEEAGFILLSYRRRASVLGDGADGVFAKEVMPDDPRPKTRTRKTTKVKTPEELAKEEERENFMPAVVGVDAAFWLRGKDDEAAGMRIRDWLSGIFDCDVVVNSPRANGVSPDGKGTPGTWVTLFLPDTLIKVTAEDITLRVVKAAEDAGKLTGSDNDGE